MHTQTALLTCLVTTAPTHKPSLPRLLGKVSSTLRKPGGVGGERSVKVQASRGFLP